MNGEWREIEVTPPLNRQPGDVYEFTDGVLQQYRDGDLIEERMLGPGVPFTPGVETGTGLLSTVYFFKARKTMAVATATNVTLAASGTLRYDFSDGSQRELAGGVVDAIALADALDSNVELAQNLIIAKSVRHSPDGTALADIIGSSCTIDTAAATPIQVAFTEDVL